MHQAAVADIRANLARERAKDKARIAELSAQLDSTRGKAHQGVGKLLSAVGFQHLAEPAVLHHAEADEADVASGRW